MPKKLIFSILFILILIVGCKKTTTTIAEEVVTTVEMTSNLKIKPVIHIKNSVVSIIVNEEIDLLTGVTALDASNSDLTSKITVNIGNFDKSKPGEYIITYRVADKDGNVTIGHKKVIVLEKSFSNEVVIKFGEETITKGEIYQHLKSLYGSYILLDLIDTELLAKYKDNFSYRIILPFEYDEYFIYEMARQYGIVKLEHEDDEAYINRILKEVYDLYLLRQQLVIDKYLKSLNNDEKNNLVNKLKNEYKEDTCVMVIRYDSKADLEKDLTLLKDLKGTDLFTKFETLWKEKRYNQTPVEINYTPYLDSVHQCSYSRLRNYDYPMFDLKTLENNTYKEFFNNQLIFKVSEAPSKETYDEEKFASELLIKYATDRYMLPSQDQLNELRKSATIIIHDELLYDQLNDPAYTFKADEKLAATVNGKGITKEELYLKLKNRFFIQQTVHYISSRLYNSKGLTVPEENIDEIILGNEGNKLVINGKTYYKYSDYVVSHVTEAKYRELKRNELLARAYILSINPIDYNKIFESYYDLNVTEISLSYNNQQNFELVVKQLLDGVGEQETPLVKLWGQPFKGLNNMTKEEILHNSLYIQSNFLHINVFQVSPYYFNQNSEEHRLLLELYKETPGSFKKIQTSSLLKIYIATKINQIPEKPSDYDRYTETELKTMVKEYQKTSNAALLPYVNYYNLYLETKTRLENNKLSDSNVGCQLINLHDEFNLSFLDQDYEAIYHEYKKYINQRCWN